MSKALERACSAIITSGLEQCLANPEATSDQEDLEKLFLFLA